MTTWPAEPGLLGEEDAAHAAAAQLPQDAVRRSDGGLKAVLEIDSGSPVGGWWRLPVPQAGGQPSRSASEADQLRPAVGIEARAADQHAVQLLPGEEREDVARVDAPPYRIGTRLVTPRDPSSNRISSCTCAASSGVAFRPVPIAQTGS